jgi:hypothetical protein
MSERAKFLVTDGLVFIVGGCKESIRPPGERFWLLFSMQGGFRLGVASTH